MFETMEYAMRTVCAREGWPRIDSVSLWHELADAKVDISGPGLMDAVYAACLRAVTMDGS